MDGLLTLDSQLKQSPVKTIVKLLTNPSTIEPALLKLSDYFTKYPLLVEQLIHILPSDQSIIPFQKKILEYINTNDPLVRSYCFYVLASTPELQHHLLNSLDKTGLEWNAICYSINQCCQVDKVFATRVARVIYHHLTNGTPSTRFIKLKVFEHADREGYGMLYTQFSKEQDLECQVSLLKSMTRLVSTDVLLLSTHLEFLFKQVEKARAEVVMGIAECFIVLAHRHGYFFTNRHVTALFEIIKSDVHLATKSTVAQCLLEIAKVIELQDMQLDWLGITIGVLAKANKYAYSIAKLVVLLMGGASEDVEMGDGKDYVDALEVYIDEILEHASTKSRWQTKVAWVLIPHLPKTSARLLKLIQKSSFEMIKEHLKWIEPGDLVSIVDDVEDPDVKLLIFRKLVPVVSLGQPELAINSSGCDDMEMAYLVFSRGYPHHALDILQKYKGCKSPFGEWLFALSCICESEIKLRSGDVQGATVGLYDAVLALRSIGGWEFQIKYLNAQLELLGCLGELLDGVVDLEWLERTKGMFEELRKDIRVDAKSNDILEYYIWQLETCSGRQGDVKSNMMNVAMNQINQLTGVEKLKGMVKVRPHPHCFFVGDVVKCDIHTDPSVEGVVVVPKHLDFVVRVWGSIKFKECERVRVVLEGEILVDAVVKNRFDVQLRYPLKPRTRVDGTIKVYVVKKREWKVWSTNVSFRK